MVKSKRLKPEQIVTLLGQINVLATNIKNHPRAVNKWAQLSNATIVGIRSMVVYM